MSSGDGSGVTRDEFVRSLGEAGLTALTELRPGEGTTGSAAAQELVDSGKLTRYQAEALLARRFDDLLMGNYEILDRLGAGGMGTVFKARHRRMKRVVALKVLSREVARSEAFVQRFQREVETIARLAHPNIVMAYDADEAKAGPFLVMEFVNGRDLASEVSAGGPLAVADAVDCVLQAARGLEYAHSQGIVHRDIKPGNLLRDAAGVVKVADLGLARLNAPGDAVNTSLTQAGGVVGTMDYMPPEQALDSTSIDHRVDVYSLGCTLYFLLAGKPPYEAGSLMALLLKHRDAPIPSLAAARPDVPPQADAVFARMVAKAPADRYATMAELATALEELKQVAPLSGVRPVRTPPKTGADTDLTGQTIVHNPGGTSLVREAGAPTPSQVARVSGRVVVLAEPSRTQAGIIRRYLEQLKVAAVHVAASGREAVEVVKRERADAVVCSMHLKDMTGVELAHALLADPECAAVGLVLATSETETADADALPESPRATRMQKPFDLQRLSTAIEHVTR